MILKLPFEVASVKRTSDFWMLSDDKKERNQLSFPAGHDSWCFERTPHRKMPDWACRWIIFYSFFYFIHIYFELNIQPSCPFEKKQQLYLWMRKHEQRNIQFKSSDQNVLKYIFNNKKGYVVGYTEIFLFLDWSAWVCLLDSVKSVTECFMIEFQDLLSQPDRDAQYRTAHTLADAASLVNVPVSRGQLLDLNICLFKGTFSASHLSVLLIIQVHCSFRVYVQANLCPADIVFRTQPIHPVSFYRLCPICQWKGSNI